MFAKIHFLMSNLRCSLSKKESEVTVQRSCVPARGRLGSERALRADDRSKFQRVGLRGAGQPPVTARHASIENAPLSTEEHLSSKENYI